MVVYKNKYLFKIIVLIVYTLGSLIVLIINMILFLKEEIFVMSNLIPLILLFIIVFFLFIQVVLAINSKREIIVSNDRIIIKNVFWKKRILFHLKDEIIIKDFKKSNEDKIMLELLPKQNLFRILNLNTDCAVRIKKDSYSRKIVNDLTEKSALELKHYIQS